MSAFPQHLEAPGPVFTYPFAASVLTTNTDVFSLTAPANSRVVIREIRLGQYSDFGDAQAELLSLIMMTGSTALGSTATLSGRNVKRYTGHPTFTTVVTGPSTTLASTTSAVLTFADTWNVAAPYLYMPAWADRPVLGLGQTWVLRMSAPNDALTVNGTLVLQEVGQGAAA